MFGNIVFVSHCALLKKISSFSECRCENKPILWKNVVWLLRVALKINLVLKICKTPFFYFAKQKIRNKK